VINTFNSKSYVNLIVRRVINTFNSKSYVSVSVKNISSVIDILFFLAFFLLLYFTDEVKLNPFSFMYLSF
jgi:hypothetical protein